MAKKYYTWMPEDQPDASVWPSQMHEEVTAAGQRLERWVQTVQSEFPALVSHLIWDRDRLQALEAAVDEVMRRDPGNLAEHRLPLYRRSLLNRLTGLGPLDAVLTDDSVTEVMVNGVSQGFVERQGRLEPVSFPFADAEEVISLAQRLASRAGREVTTELPLCDAELADGSRIHCVLPPVAEEPTITIRRSPHRELTLDDYLRLGSVSEPLWSDLAALVRDRVNILITGGAGSGKTSLLRILAAEIPAAERLITIEDVRELRLRHPHVVSLEAHRQHTVQTLVRNALRMRPDRIIVGEVRGEEAFDLIDAMGTGHPGSLSSFHASAGDMRAIHRLARMAVRTPSGLPYLELIKQIQETVGIVIYVVRDSSGHRRIDSVARLSGDAEPISYLWRYDSTLRQFVAGDRS